MNFINFFQRKVRLKQQCFRFEFSHSISKQTKENTTGHTVLANPRVLGAFSASTALNQNRKTIERSPIFSVVQSPPGCLVSSLPSYLVLKSSNLSSRVNTNHLRSPGTEPVPDARIPLRQFPKSSRMSTRWSPWSLPKILGHPTR